LFDVFDRLFGGDETQNRKRKAAPFFCARPPPPRGHAGASHNDA